MSIDAMKQAIEALEEINKLSIGENAICLPAEIDGAITALRAAIEQSEQRWVKTYTGGKPNYTTPEEQPVECYVKTWQQRCEEHPDHDGIVTERMIQARMQEEIDDLRAAIKQTKQRKPVAWRKHYENSGYTYYDARWKNIPQDAEPLYL